MTRARAAALPLPIPDDRPTSPKRLHVEVIARHTAAIYGGRMVGLCQAARVPHVWRPDLRTWVISRRRVDDLLVYAEHVERRFTTVTTVTTR